MSNVHPWKQEEIVRPGPSKGKGPQKKSWKPKAYQMV